MVCKTCNKDIPANVQFCMGCGTEVKKVAISNMDLLASKRQISSSFGIFTNQTTASRPFGLVLAAVVTFCTAISWLLASGFLTILTITESIAGANSLSGSALNILQDQSGSVFLSPTFVSISAPLLTLASFIGITGAVGLWSRFNWARLLTAWLQIFGLIIGLVILSQAGARVLSTAGLGGFFAFSGMIVIAYSAAIMVYLFRHDTAQCFNG